MATLQRALEIAVEAHANVLDKGGVLYVLHPIRMLVKAKSENEKIVAALHDVVEDCEDWTLERIREEGFSHEIVDALDRLTRRKNETYFEFIERCCESILSIEVKLLDIEDNLDITRLQILTEDELGRIKRYFRARRELLHARDMFYASQLS